MMFLANMGVPMIAIQMPAMLWAFVPIVMLESLLVRDRLSLRPFKVFSIVAAANLYSTLIGIPVAWFVITYVQTLNVEAGLGRVPAHFHADPNSPLWACYEVLISFGWLHGHKTNLYWMVPLASALLLIPSYFVSVWLEGRVCRRAWRQIEPRVVAAAVTHANRVSYAALFFFACVWLGWRLLSHA